MSLRIGSEGSDVEALQKQLGVDADGIFGRQTKSAVISFQQANGLYPDGIVGPATQAVLDAAKQGTHPTVPGKPRTLLVDLYDGDIIDDWNKLYAAGVRAAWIKVNQGVGQGSGRPQKRYIEHKKAAEAAGIITGPYSFWMPDEDIEVQANIFCDLVLKAGFRPGLDAPPMLDLEFDPESRGVRKGDGAKALRWLEVVEKRLGVTPWLYSGNFTMQEIFDNEPATESKFARFKLWLAYYAPEAKIQWPKIWAKWTVWQFSGEYPIPGVSRTQNGRMDANWFDGSPADLIAAFAESVVKAA